MEQLFGTDWTITPAGGSTGEAYMASNHEKRLFLKRNSSPFLAVLSAEGIVPKLLWTKRMANGDVITAQHWLEGRELDPEEMQHPQVARMLSKIHHSPELLDMLLKIGKAPILPNELLREIRLAFRNVQPDQIELYQAFKYLKETLSYVENQPQVVCHCDLNHNNWLLSEDGQLFLIDWDSAKVADPAMDIGMLLFWYIPEEDWGMWLEQYGATNEFIKERMYWYLMLYHVSNLLKEKEKSSAKAQQYLIQLRRLLARVQSNI
ncbi:phosphotransferase family protein [Radiobacillus kanasensis]|uniref:phosphotransferase family protein n=1 Tax=Radiobacillus kanasensis TaxID=2844358 RepID=UPI001E567661|nr:phosphotransferase family protein [Radiobacillus kanasensis]UFT98151.1 phosphotransferase family protein [Radiobacillus kanasensis]